MATIVRGPRAADHFTIISNHALRDERLSWKARGLLAYLLSMDTGWNTSVRRLATVAPDGKSAVDTALTELETCGYLERRQSRADGDKPGTFSGTEYHVRDDAAVTRFSGNGDVSGLTVTRFSDDGSSDNGSSATKKTSPKKTSPKKTQKARGGSSVVVSPPVTRAEPTTTNPEQKLEDAGVAARDRGRFREYLRTVKNARSADAVIAKVAQDDLAAQVREWKASLDITTEAAAEPILCDHGHDISLGTHMCPVCDPARQRTHNHTPEPTTARPDWLRDLLATGEHDGLAALIGSEHTA